MRVGSALAQGFSRFGAVTALCAAIMIALAGTLATPAEANSKYAAFVMDKTTGAVLYARNADSYRYPASLTKIMTLYILFEEMERGAIAPNQPLVASKRAAGMAPSKLGLKPGETITAEEAIKALVTKSANDVAVIVAEAVAGSEYAFAQRMTKTARAMGMTRTTFRNASGLPDSKQRTTARDMATLAQRVQDDFPQYYPYFAVTQFTWNGRTYKTHNNLLGKYDYAGTDGIKTGYIRASGFNLTSSVRRGQDHLIGVVMGGRTTKSRDMHMMDILDKAFVRVASADYRNRYAPVYAKLAPTPAVNPTRTPAGITVAALPETRPETLPEPEIQPDSVIANEAIYGTPTAPAPTSGQLASATESESASEPEPTRYALSQMASWIVTPAYAHGGDYPDGPVGNEARWSIQIGAYGSRDKAESRVMAALTAAPDILASRVAATIPVANGPKTLYRSRFDGFEEADARATCTSLAKRGISCIAVPPADFYPSAVN